MSTTGPHTGSGTDAVWRRPGTVGFLRDHVGDSPIVHGRAWDPGVDRLRWPPPSLGLRAGVDDGRLLPDRSNPVIAGHDELGVVKHEPPTCSQSLTTDAGRAVTQLERPDHQVSTTRCAPSVAAAVPCGLRSTGPPGSPPPSVEKSRVLFLLFFAARHRSGPRLSEGIGDSPLRKTDASRQQSWCHVTAGRFLGGRPSRRCRRHRRVASQVDLRARRPAATDRARRHRNGSRETLTRGAATSSSCRRPWWLRDEPRVRVLAPWVEVAPPHGRSRGGGQRGFGGKGGTAQAFDL